MTLTAKLLGTQSATRELRRVHLRVVNNLAYAHSSENVCKYRHSPSQLCHLSS